MPPIPAWKDLPQRVQLLKANGDVIVAALECRIWNPPTPVDENDPSFPVAMPGATRTMWCDFDPRVEFGQFILTNPVGDGQSGVDERYMITAVENTAGIGWRMQCTLQRAARSA